LYTVPYCQKYTPYTLLFRRFCPLGIRILTSCTSISCAHFQDCVYKIKQDFNKAFDDVYNIKSLEMKRISERNTRVQKILNDLSMEEQLVTVQISPLEQPERLFTVDDSEVTVEKYISEEERQRLEELARLEEGLSIFFLC